MSTLKVNNLQDLGADAVVTNGVVNASALPAGSILQVVSTTKTDTFSTTSTSFTDITGLSVSITPSSTSSKVLVLVQVKISQGTNNEQIFSLLVRDSTPINIGAAAGSRRQSLSMSLLNYTNSNLQVFDGNAIFLDSPSTTSATTYKMQLAVAAGTGYVNRSAADTDSVGASRMASTITVMEVAG